MSPKWDFRLFCSGPQPEPGVAPATEKPLLRYLFNERPKELIVHKCLFLTASNCAILEEFLMWKMHVILKISSIKSDIISILCYITSGGMHMDW